MKKNIENNQLKFIELLKSILPQNFSLVNELSDLLEISADSAYRRIRCETTFAFDEIIKICNQYKISFDSFCTLENTGVVKFNYSRISSDVNSFKEFLTGMLNDLKKNFTTNDKEIIYVAEDIPIFHLFKYPELAAFKMFYWMKSVLNIPDFEGKKYNRSLIDESIFETGKQIINIYSKFPSTEIWSDRTVSSVIKQIEYYFESGMFETKNDALHICDVLSDALIDIQSQAEHSTKATVAGFENNFTMYNSDIETGNNCILVRAAGLKTIHLRYHTFNNMVTTDALFFDMTDKWLKGLIKKSNLISGVAEKQRFQFFQKTQDKIKELKERM